MTCAWKELLAILPPAIRKDVDRLGRDTLQEVRLRCGQAAQLVLSSGSRWISYTVSEQDLSFVINAASRYSPWTAASAAMGYITAPGGHRIGLCGEVVVKDGQVTGIRIASSLCIRVARDFPKIAEKAATFKGNILLLGPPGSGKTTFLRDLIRQISNGGSFVCAVDERGELFPASFPKGDRTDVLTGCSKAQGIEMSLRTMGPTVIAVDEITAPSDCQALMQAGWCGVRLIATAHAANFADLKARPIYRSLWECRLFETAIILRPDKSWYTERMIV